jgi:hypothetical protein
VRVGSRLINLHPYEARTVTAITIDPGGDNELALVSTDWMLDPITNPDGVWGQILLRAGVVVTSSSFDTIPVAVTGTWGWAAVPAEAIGWLHQLVEDRFNEDVAFYADADGSMQSAQPVTVPYQLRQQMDPWRRVYIGSA